MTGALDNLKIGYVDSIDAASDMFTWLSTADSSRPLAFDLETTGLDMRAPGAAVRLLTVGDDRQCWAIGMHEWRAVAHDVLRKWDGDLVGHNAKFDINWLHHCEGIDVTIGRVIHDTMLYSHLVDARQRHGLKELSDKYIERGASSGQRKLKAAFVTNGWDWDTIPVDHPLYWSYGALDASLTRILFDTFDREYPSVRGTRSYDIETAVMPVMAKMERFGCAVDLEYVESGRAKALKYVDDLDAYLNAEYGCHVSASTFNPGSNGQAAEALINCGVSLTETTDSGRWRLDKEILEGIDHPLARHVLERRKVLKIAGTYLSALTEPVAYPGIRQCGAITGRSSITKTSTAPALQTIPRGTAVRDAFVAREGCLLIISDLDQVEMRVMAEFCRDANLIDAISSGDLHTETARMVYNDPTITADDPRRQTAKNSGFAKIYGAGLEQFAKTAGVSEAEAKQFLALYDSTFPGVDQWFQDTANSNTETGVQSPFGRVHRLNDDRDYAIVNYLVQGTAGEVLKHNMVMLDAAGIDLMFPIHDEIIAEAPVGDAEEVAAEVQRLMTFNEFVVPLTAGVDIVERWGDKYR